MGWSDIPQNLRRVDLIWLVSFSEFFDGRTESNVDQRDHKNPSLVVLPSLINSLNTLPT